jgi:hypothetical protein
MKRINPNFRFATLSDEETESFLDELFTNLLDQDDITAESDAIPNLSILDR